MKYETCVTHKKKKTFYKQKCVYQQNHVNLQQGHNNNEKQPNIQLTVKSKVMCKLC